MFVNDNVTALIVFNYIYIYNKYIYIYILFPQGVKSAQYEWRVFICII